MICKLERRLYKSKELDIRLHLRREDIEFFLLLSGGTRHWYNGNVTSSLKKKEM